MVSSVLAQAILSQKAPDLVGSFNRGAEEARQGKVRELSGDALKGNQGALDQLAGLDPEIAMSLGEVLRARSAKDINDFVRDAKIGLNQLNSGDVQGAKSFAYQRRDAIKQRGGDTTQTDEFISLLESGDVEGARQSLQGFVGIIDQAKQPSAIVERDRLLKDLESPDERVRRSAEIALKLSAPASTGLTPDEQVNLARDKAMARAEVELGTAGDIERIKAEQKATGKGISERQQGFIDSGVSAADSTANIRRSIALLDEVKTGGFASVAQKAKNLLGIESANEGELAANLGQSVLAQLKPLFGAAFTAAEGERLESISARFGLNAETNKRLLEQILKVSERSARRAIKAAEDAGDDFTAQEIKDALEFVLDDSKAGATQSPPQSPQQATGGIKFMGFE
jgi:hypothetical protein